MRRRTNYVDENTFRVRAPCENLSACEICNGLMASNCNTYYKSPTIKSYSCIVFRLEDLKQEIYILVSCMRWVI